jgi:hypothetical protein
MKTIKVKYGNIPHMYMVEPKTSVDISIGDILSIEYPDKDAETYYVMPKNEISDCYKCALRKDSQTCSLYRGSKIKSLLCEARSGSHSWRRAFIFKKMDYILEGL